ncbi:addiction module protein [Spirulina sp. CS-785/01]|uniref:addiction module protein n=1 Tax=Spirulina sp. CS-785/01 TaxID=3021716 RepID=UPI00232BF747|nr:addiction module protein [Spirulina sp. CS-785/01]MDB9315353.1 addiction module protein [Spirulina sp. CS-785/01]
MTESAKKLLQEALHLSPTERVLLIDALVSSLDQPDAQIDQLWLAEAEQRLNAYHTGQLEAIPAEQVFEEIKNL